MNDAYKQAGVDIEAGYEAVNRIKKVVQKTHRPEVLNGIGGFGALFQLDVSKYKQPVLVSGTDGVGTKLKLAFDLNTHHTIGIDAVAMCVNDIAVQGAEPLFFLDYVACGKLEPDQIEAIVSGIAEGCVQAGCALIGGETAEMPGFYPQGEYDVAGFCVGAVDKDSIIDGTRVKSGDVIIGVGSSGVHSNGFSLVRKLINDHGISLNQPFAEQFPAYSGSETVGEVLLTPTKIYVRAIQALIQKHQIKSMGHITGGGFFENIPRALPEGLAADITLNTWDIPMVFQWLQQLGSLNASELFSTFNMGIGLVVIVAEEEADAALVTLKEAGEQAYIIGKVTTGNNKVTLLDERNAPCQL